MLSFAWYWPQNYTVSQKKDSDVAHYNLHADQPILIIFGRDVAETVCYQTVICYPTSENCLFSPSAYGVLKTKWLGKK